MTDTPTIILVHGFWGDANHWAKVITRLAKLGHTKIRAVQNPLTSLTDDAERTRKMIAQVDGPVLLAGHSYGGAVITQAGNQPNVAGLVYIAAFAPDTGESLATINEQAPATQGLQAVTPDSDGFIWLDPEKFGESFCQDLPADEQLVMAVTQKAPLGPAYGEPGGDPAWRRKPCWYQISSQDRMIHPDNQVRMSGRMGATTITLDAGHASLASRPDEVAELIDQAARAVAS